METQNSNHPKKWGVNTWTYTTILLLALFAGYILVNNKAPIIDKKDLEEQGIQVVEIEGHAATVYNYPVQDLYVVFNPECRDTDCPIDDLINNISTSIPGTRSHLFEKDSEEGKKMIEDYNLAYTPSVLFSENISAVPNFAQISQDMILINDKYLLNIEKGGISTKIEYFDTSNEFENVPNEYQNLLKGVIRGGKQDDILPTDSPSKGVQDGKIQIVNYSDFQCQYCQKFALETLPLLFEQYGQDLEYHFVNYIGAVHPRALPAAVAASCANEQGKYFEMHDLLFKELEWRDTTDNEIFKKYALDLGLDAELFNSCIDNEETISKVRADQDFAESINVRLTPTIFVNGYKVEGAYPIEVFKALIDHKE